MPIDPSQPITVEGDFSEPTPSPKGFDSSQPFTVEAADSGQGGFDSSKPFTVEDQPASDIPKTDQALSSIQKFAKTEAAFEEKYSPDWLKNFATAADEMVKGIPGMAKQIPGQLYQAGMFVTGGPQIQREVATKILRDTLPQSQQMAKDLQSPPGSHEWWRGILQAGQMALPALEFLPKLRGLGRAGIEKPPVQPPPIPPEYAERRFTLAPEPGLAPAPSIEETLAATEQGLPRAVSEKPLAITEQPPEIAPAGTIEETLQRVGEPQQRISPETGLPIYPEAEETIGLPSETARVVREGGEIADAARIQSTGTLPELEVRARMGEEAPLRGQPEGAAAAGAQPGPAAEAVAPAAPEAYEPGLRTETARFQPEKPAAAPTIEGLTPQEAQQITDLQRQLRAGEIDQAGYAKKAQEILGRASELPGTAEERRAAVPAEEAQPGSATNPPPVQVATHEPPGIANRVIEDAIKRGDLPKDALVTGEGWNANQARAFGRAEIAKDPTVAFKIARRIRQIGGMNPGDPAVLHAYNDMLNTIAKDARTKADAVPNDPNLEAAAKAAEKAEVDFLQQVLPLAKGAVQKQMVGFQGAYPPDLETFAGMRKEMVNNSGKELSPDQRAELYRRANKTQGATKKEVAGRDNLQKAIDRTLPKREIPTKEQMQARAAEFIRKAAPCG